MPQDPAKIQVLRSEVATLLQKSHRGGFRMSSQERFLQSSFWGEETIGGWRPVIDLSCQFVLRPHFKMETLESIRLSLQKGDWMTSLDLSDAYFHIPIHRRSRRYLRFVFDSKVFQFQALPFGLSVSSYVFTRVLKMVLRYVPHSGIRVHAYLDNWIQPSASEALSWLHSR